MIQNKHHCLILFAILLLVGMKGYCQINDKEDLYGKWRILGSFKNGKQTLTALKDTISNSKHYYFYFNEDGTYKSDIVSLKKGYAGNIMRGKWMFDNSKDIITFIRVLNREEKRNIPSHWTRTDKNGITTLTPVEYPVIEFSKDKLVLFDKQHNELDIYIR